MMPLNGVAHSNEATLIFGLIACSESTNFDHSLNNYQVERLSR